MNCHIFRGWLAVGAIATSASAVVAASGKAAEIPPSDQPIAGDSGVTSVEVAGETDFTWERATPDPSMTAVEISRLSNDNVEFTMVLGMRRDEPASAGDAQPAAAGTGNLAKKLANPISDLISVPFQFNYDEGFGPADAGRYSLNIQPVIPISISDDWSVVSRTIVPVIYQDSLASGIGDEFGLGDVLQSLFFSPKEPVNGWILGAGPVFLIPTATDPSLGSENLGLGPTVVALRQNDGWTYGALANHIWSVYSDDDREEVNSTFIQPFVAYTWPTATTLTVNTEATYDWNSEQWNVPINATLSQVLKVGGQPISLQFGPRYYAESFDGGPEWGIRFGVTLLFPGG